MVDSRKYMWKVELWVIPVQVYGWDHLYWGKAHLWWGPWRWFKTLWVKKWENLRQRVRNAAVEGLYHRMCFCIEEFEYFEDIDKWIAVDQA